MQFALRFKVLIMNSINKASSYTFNLLSNLLLKVGKEISVSGVVYRHLIEGQFFTDQPDKIMSRLLFKYNPIPFNLLIMSSNLAQPKHKKTTRMN